MTFITFHNFIYILNYIYLMHKIRKYHNIASETKQDMASSTYGI